MPCAVEAVAGRAYWTPSPARKTCTSWPSSAAVRATSSASAPRVGFSGPVARCTSNFAMSGGWVLSETGMHAAESGLGHLKLLKQINQKFTFLAINPGAQPGLIVDGYLPSALQGPASLPGEVQPAHAPVLRIRAPLDEPRLLEMVHERDHAARGDVEPLRERLLRAALVRGHEAQEQELPRVYAHRLERVHEALGREEAELRYQEAHAARRCVGRGRLDSQLLVSHVKKITRRSHSCYKPFQCVMI